MYKYKLYAMSADLKEYYKTIKRKNKLSQEKMDELAGRFADDIAWSKNKNVPLYGCSEIEDE